MRPLLKYMSLQQSMHRSTGNALDRNVSDLVTNRLSCVELLNCECVCCSAARLDIGITMYLCVQEAGTSRAVGGFSRPRGDPNVERPWTGNAPGRPPQPQPTTTQALQVIARQVIPSGHTYAGDGQASPVPSARIPLRSASVTVDLITPPKATQTAAARAPDTAKSRANAKRNLTRNLNRKANATFAKELKESLASGQPAAVNVAAEQSNLKGAWHIAAKEAAYKYLDLRKESWKDYNQFEKAQVHKELAAQYRCNPPIDIECVDKYLSGHLRTSRAVWKAHWRKYGPSRRHHNCPVEAWEKLTTWWPTERCREEAAEMSNRRAMVEGSSKVGRNSLLHRMDAQVRLNFVWCAIEFE